ncbi:MAG: hypothetical protein IT564_06270 [Rhodospirillales bacterium]|nr:hypothetical protein [Rhodospirillales bacterium]
MNFGEEHGPVGQPNARDAFSFPPTAPTVKLTQAGDFANGGAGSEGFRIRDIVENRKIH